MYWWDENQRGRLSVSVWQSVSMGLYWLGIRIRNKDMRGTVQMQVPKRPDSDGLDGEHLVGRMLRVEVTAGNRAEKFIEGMMEQVDVREKRMQRIKWRQPIGCGHPERNGPKGGDKSNQNSSLPNPQNPLWLCWAAEQKHTCSHTDPTSVQKCTHCLTCTWFVSHLVNLRQQSSRSGTDLHSSGRRCCPAAGWPLCQHPVRKCEATAPRPAACTALRLVYTGQAKQCDCTSKHIVPILTHTGETEHVQPVMYALFSRLHDSEFYRSSWRDRVGGGGGGGRGLIRRRQM